jgi:hypothetical protein
MVDLTPRTLTTNRLRRTMRRSKFRNSIDSNGNLVCSICNKMLCIGEDVISLGLAGIIHAECLDKVLHDVPDDDLTPDEEYFIETGEWKEVD